jgi:hypothetical protein
MAGTTTTVTIGEEVYSAVQREIYIDRSGDRLKYSGKQTFEHIGTVIDDDPDNVAVKKSGAAGGGSSDASATNQIAGNNLLTSIESKTPPLVSGRQPVDGSGVTQPISATFLPLPTGAATSANQATSNTSLGNIDTNIGARADTEATTNTGTFSLIQLVKRLINTSLAFGQKPMASSLPVTIASDQIPLTITQGKTEYVKSTGNSTTTQLPATATFPGVIVDVLAYPAVIVSAVSDQPYTVKVFQYIDLAGTQLVGTSTFTRLANQPFNNPVKLNGNYAKVTVQNTGGATTTLLAVDTYLGSMETLPSELTNLGNLKTAIVEDQTIVGASNFGQYSVYRNEALLATPQTIKATVGNIYGINIINPNTTPIYIKFFDAATVTLGTTTPIETIAVGASSGFTVEPKNVPWSYFQTNSIKIVATTGRLTADIIAPTIGVLTEIKYL